MQALVEINGKQYPVEEGRYVQIDRYDAEENAEVTLDKVFMVVAGEQSVIGAPFVDGATVKAQVRRHGKDTKITVYKMHRKKGYRRKYGHRQQFTELQIVSVDFPGKDKVKVEPKADSAETKKTPKKSADTKVSAQAESKKPAAKAKSEPKSAKAEPAKAEPAKAEESKAEQE